jgi:hypothetical protein
MSSATSIKRYLGFYLSRPFWAIDRLDLDNINLQEFTQLMM